jgi:hypothetical protein
MSFTIIHLPAADSSSAVFELQVSSRSAYNKYVSEDPSQYQFTVRLALANSSALPLVLPEVERNSVFKLDLTPFSVLTAAYKPKIEVVAYDHQAFTLLPQQTLTLDSSWTPAPLSVSAYIEALNNNLAAATGSDLLRKLNLAAYTCNQAFYACKTGGSCLTDDAPIRNLRETLWNSFKGFWTTVTDKDGWQDWTTSVLKNSFISAVSLTGDSMTDATISAIDTELEREFTSLTTAVSAAIQGLPRTHFKLGENLKAIQRLTSQNLDLLISAYSHNLMLFNSFHKSLTDTTAFQTKMNNIFSRIALLNEIKLLRYTVPSATSIFENELIQIFGTTLIGPLDSSYLFKFSGTVAVEIKGLEFDSNLVNLSNLRISTSYR